MVDQFQQRGDNLNRTDEEGFGLQASDFGPDSRGGRGRLGGVDENQA
jgi:hypothetical protein